MIRDMYKIGGNELDLSKNHFTEINCHGRAAR